MRLFENALPDHLKDKLVERNQLSWQQILRRLYRSFEKQKRLFRNDKLKYKIQCEDLEPVSDEILVLDGFEIRRHMVVISRRVQESC